MNKSLFSLYKRFQRSLGVSVILLGGLSQTAWAIVSVEQERFTAAKPGVHGTLSGSVSGQSGNSNQEGWEVGSALKWGTESSQWMWLVDRAYAQAEEVSIQDKGWTHLRWYQPRPSPFGVEVFAQLSQNAFTSLESRSVLGAGTRIRVTEEPGLEMHFLGAGAFYEREQLKGQDSDPVLRGNFYWSWFLKSTEPSLSWGQVLYLQPNLQETGDHRILEELSVKLQLTSAVYLKLGFNLSLDNAPPEGIQKIDRSFDLSLGADF